MAVLVESKVEPGGWENHGFEFSCFTNGLSVKSYALNENQPHQISFYFSADNFQQAFQKGQRLTLNALRQIAESKLIQIQSIKMTSPNSYLTTLFLPNDMYDFFLPDISMFAITHSEFSLPPITASTADEAIEIATAHIKSELNTIVFEG